MSEESNTSTCLALIQSKLDRIHEDVEKNSKDIISLKEQVAMGKGGLKAVFIVGAFIGLIVTSFTLFKEMF